MIAAAIPSLANPVCHHAKSHDDFLPLIPIVARHARIVFRHLPVAEREEAATEAIAAAFQSFVRLKARGKLVSDLRSGIAKYAVLHAKSGRRVGTPINTNDVLSPQAQRRHGFKVESLSSAMDRSLREHDHRPVQRHADVIDERLQDNTKTPPDEQAAFRIDFRDWLAGWGRRDRKMIGDLAQGERTGDVAAKFGVSAARVSQRRRRFQTDWQRFYNESPAGANEVVVA